MEAEAEPAATPEAAKADAAEGQAVGRGEAREAQVQAVGEEEARCKTTKLAADLTEARRL